MAGKTKIEWVKKINPDGSVEQGATWNPVTGCSKESEACKNCYAERDWPRLAANPKTRYHGRKFTDVACHEEILDQPVRWGKARMIFVNSMSDLFHPDVPTEFIDKVYAIMGLCFVMDKGHTFQVLTKRPQRMFDYFANPETVYRVTRLMKALGPELPGENSPPVWPLPNVWAGVTVENQKRADERLPVFLNVPAAVHFVSMEPLLGAVDLTAVGANGASRVDTLRGEKHVLRSIKHYEASIDQVIVGGESGPKARPMHPNWIEGLRQQCEAAGVPFLFKQWGEWIPRSLGVMSDGQKPFAADPEAEKWPTMRLGENGGDTRDLANMDEAGEMIYMQRVGRKLAGRLFNNKLHDGYPTSSRYYEPQPYIPSP